MPRSRRGVRMYLTTSRKPSLLSKRLCRVLSRLFTRGVYENRGKKSVEEVFSRAKQLGKSRALVLHEHKGNPERILFMEISKEWSWLSPEIRITKLGKLPEKEALPRSSSLSLEGEMKQKLEHLFNPEPETGDEEVRLVLNSEDWSFYSGKKKLFTLGVSYVEAKQGE